MTGTGDVTGSIFSLGPSVGNRFAGDCKEETSDMVDGVARESVEFDNGGRWWALSPGLEVRENGLSSADTYEAASSWPDDPPELLYGELPQKSGTWR